MFNFSDVLRLLQAVGPITAAIPVFRQIWDQIVDTFDEHDQATLKAAYADLIADNDEGHERLQLKLAEAALRG